MHLCKVHRDIKDARQTCCCHWYCNSRQMTRVIWKACGTTLVPNGATLTLMATKSIVVQNCEEVMCLTGVTMVCGAWGFDGQSAWVVAHYIMCCLAMGGHEVGTRLKFVPSHWFSQINVLVMGILKSFGFLSIALQETFDASMEQISWIGSIMSCVRLTAGTIKT